MIYAKRILSILLVLCLLGNTATTIFANDADSGGDELPPDETVVGEEPAPEETEPPDGEAPGDEKPPDETAPEETGRLQIVVDNSGKLR